MFISTVTWYPLLLFIANVPFTIKLATYRNFIISVVKLVGKVLINSLHHIKLATCITSSA